MSDIVRKVCLSIYLWLYSPCVPWPLFQFLNLYTVRLLGRGISPSQGRYLHTEQHKHRINTHTDIHASSGIRTQDPSVQVGKDSSCLRPCGRCDCLKRSITAQNFRVLHKCCFWAWCLCGSHVGITTDGSKLENKNMWWPPLAWCSYQVSQNSIHWFRNYE
jgi:hypothetical protein